MKKLFILLVAVSCFAISANAQRFSEMFSTGNRGNIGYGVRAGYNVSNAYGFWAYGSESEKYNYSPVSGGHIYGFVDIPITNGFYIQSGLSIISKGFSEKDKGTIDETNSYSYGEKWVDKYSAIPVYFEIPVLASFRADITGNMNLQLGVGPYFAAAVGGRYLEIERGRNKKAETPYHYRGVESTPLFTDDYALRRFDLGITISAGIVLFRHYYAGLSYDAGIFNIMKTKDLKEAGGSAYMHNGTFSISIGYNF